MSASFTHPTHARGVKSRWPDGTDSGPLTDKKILKYALRGYYGPNAQASALEIKARRNKSTHPHEGTKIKKLLSFLEDLCKAQS